MPRSSTHHTKTKCIDHDDLWPGRLVVWTHTPRGGYGFSVSVPAKVIRVRGKRVTIEATRADGTKVLRAVAESNLRNTPETELRLAGAKEPTP